LQFIGFDDGVSHVEARYPAILFKQQLTACVEKIFGLLRDNLKKELSPLLASCIQVIFLTLWLYSDPLEMLLVAKFIVSRVSLTCFNVFSRTSGSPICFQSIFHFSLLYVRCSM